MYAIINLKGKQHKVSAGEVVRVDKLNLESGSTIEFDQVLYVSDDENVKVGAPYLENAKVTGEVLNDFKDKKIFAFFYRRRKGSARKVGHRQTYTNVKIKEIVH